MGNLLGKKSKSKVTEQDKAVLQLKQQRDKLRQYQKRIENSMENDRKLAKTLVAEGKRDRALLLLRKKRYQETLLSNTDNQLHTLEQLAVDIEFAQIEVQVFDGLKQGNQALKDINATLNIDEIEAMLEETKEAHDKQQEISDLLSGVLTMEDEDAVLDEYDMLVQQEMDVSMDSFPAVPLAESDIQIAESDEDSVVLPAVPEHRIKPTPSRAQREAVLES